MLLAICTNRYPPPRRKENIMANTVEDLINDMVCEKVEEEINNADIETIVEDKISEYLDDNITDIIKNNITDIMKIIDAHKSK